MPQKPDDILPNFLIVGAAKSGTTSLANYLNEHPNIFISKIKEPRYLVSKAIKKVSKKDPSLNYLLSNSALDFTKYRELFKNRTEKAIGEASVHYLYHYDEAIANINSLFSQDIKIIILLRNPVERAISNWKYQDKDMLSLSAALEAEEKRKQIGYNSFWYYKELGCYYKQVKAYLDNFKNVKILLFEDLINNTNSVVQELYSFLEVDTSYQNAEYKKFNDSSISIVPKNTQVKKLLKTQKRVNLFKKAVKSKLIPGNLIDNKNELVTQQDIKYLKEFYKEDIIKLQKEINRDLTSWL